jgi:integrase
VNPVFLKDFFPKRIQSVEGMLMSGFAMKTAGVFLPLLKPSRYKGAHGGRGSGKPHFSPSTPHPILGDELRALRRLQREQEPKSAFAFTSERGAPFSPAGFARMIERAGIEAKLAFKAHPHMLRHACGYKLANDGHDTRALQAYLGHKNIQHTVRYTELAPARFKDFWRK